MKDLEHNIQVNLMDWLRLQYPAEYKLTFAVPNGGHRHIVTATKLKREGVKAGVPDIFMAAPRKGCHGLFIELKHDKGRPTKEQLVWLDALANEGYCAQLCKGFDSAKSAIESYLN